MMFIELTFFHNSEKFKLMVNKIVAFGENNNKTWIDLGNDTQYTVKETVEQIELLISQKRIK